jgi:methionyl-tRNA formyltransferase
MKVAILTSNHYRHKYFINEVSKHHEVVGVVMEEKSFIPLKYADNKKDERIIQEHFLLREKEEEQNFDKEVLDGISVLALPAKSVNTNEVLAYLLSKSPDYLFVYGTGIIGEELIKEFDGRIINMHLGLSPFYRGAGTNFYPIYNNEPEFCGVTIHYLDAGIDTGEIISRGRAVIKAKDNPHSLGCRIIKVGIKLIIESLERIRENNFRPIKQNLGIGKVYYRKDFNAQKVTKVYELIANGQFEKIENKQFNLLQEVPVYDI